jgi:hypothetical protein
LERGAPVDVKDESHDGTPLDWALYAWGSSTESGRYYDVVALLVRAGAKLDPQWYEDDDDRRLAATKMRSDALMRSALAGKMPSGAKVKGKRRKQGGSSPNRPGH